MPDRMPQALVVERFEIFAGTRLASEQVTSDPVRGSPAQYRSPLTELIELSRVSR